MPDHIDQLKLPKGAYWDRRDRIWYTLLTVDGKAKRKRLAGKAATLADLHQVLEELTVKDLGTIAWLHGEFCLSDTCKKLSESTRRDYGACVKLLARTPTKIGIQCDQLMVDKLRRVDIQLIVDKIGASRPAMANHVKRYLGRLFAWGMQRGKCKERANPAHGLEAATEVKDAKMPELATMERVIAFARDRGGRQAHAAGSCAPYLWIVMVLAYRCRLRGIEVLTMTEDQGLAEGILAKRRKGSRNNITAWSPELTEAWDAAIRHRDAVWAGRRKPVPLHAKDRPLLVIEKGTKLTRSGLDTAWQRLMKTAIEAGVIEAADRFSLHGLKHRGITDSKDKKAGGHKSDAMKHLYDHELTVFDQAGHE